MELSEMIEVLKAYEKGEKIECRQQKGNRAAPWGEVTDPSWSFDCLDYRIAPKKMTLVEELRDVAKEAGVFNLPVEQVVLRAADRIEELEGFGKKSLYCYTTNELLVELGRRVK